MIRAGAKYAGHSPLFSSCLRVRAHCLPDVQKNQRADGTQETPGNNQTRMRHTSDAPLNERGDPRDTGQLRVNQRAMIGDAIGYDDRGADNDHKAKREDRCEPEPEHDIVHGTPNEPARTAAQGNDHNEPFGERIIR